MRGTATRMVTLLYFRVVIFWRMVGNVSQFPGHGAGKFRGTPEPSWRTACLILSEFGSVT